MAEQKAVRLEGSCETRVLVVDDEEQILALIKDMLEGNGFLVDTALDGEAALQKIEKQAYDLILTDWKMPRLNGRDLYERLARTRPGQLTRIIFMSGDVLNEQMQTFIRDTGVVFLAKPFSLDEIRVALVSVLNLK